MFVKDFSSVEREEEVITEEVMADLESIFAEKDILEDIPIGNGKLKKITLTSHTFGHTATSALATLLRAIKKYEANESKNFKSAQRKIRFHFTFQNILKKYSSIFRWRGSS